MCENERRKTYPKNRALTISECPAYFGSLPVISSELFVLRTPIGLLSGRKRQSMIESNIRRGFPCATRRVI